MGFNYTFNSEILCLYLKSATSLFKFPSTEHAAVHGIHCFPAVSTVALEPWIIINYIESVRFTILTSLVENTEMKSILVANHTGSKFELPVNDPSEGYLVKSLVKIASLVLGENPPETFKHFNR